ncbi:MAG: helix-turn-helix domain-containing protein, partial [Chloroflexi bacterium]|nr:helix-turn-helix domain-containing protein [Chloroflexota bacterium]
MGTKPLFNDSANNTVENDEFRQALLERHAQIFQKKKEGGSLSVDKMSKGFGRYIRAARIAKKKSYTDISRSSGLSESLLQAIEIGLIPSDKIKNEWIKNLAYALVE